MWQWWSKAGMLWRSIGGSAREERLTAADDRRKEVEARIQEALNTPPHLVIRHTGLEADSPMPDMGDIERTLERLKIERERLGAVNLRAEEEQKELSERLEAIVSEREDIIEAIRKLRQAILSLNREGRERLLAAMGWSVVLWITIAAGIWAVALAFRIEMPYTGGWLMLAPLVVGVAVPTPGSVGGFHEAFRLGATAFFGADNDIAVGAAIVLHAVSLGPVTIAGLIFIVQDGLNLGGLANEVSN